MKRTVITFVIAGAMLATVGTLTLRTGASGEHDQSQPVVMRGPSEEDTVQASRREDVEMADTVPSETSGPDLDDVSGIDSMLAGGLNGGVVLGTNPVLTGGKGGIGGDTWSRADEVMLTGGKGGISGDTWSRADAVVIAGGRGGIGGDTWSLTDGAASAATR